jgi:hypothetical protein
VIETALNQELSEHLGHDKNGQPDPSWNVRNRTRLTLWIAHLQQLGDSLEATGHDPVALRNLGGFLAEVGTEDAPGELDKASFPPDRGGEEQGVQGRAIETLAYVGAGGHDRQRRAAWPELQAG